MSELSQAIRHRSADFRPAATPPLEDLRARRRRRDRSRGATGVVLTVAAVLLAGLGPGELLPGSHDRAPLATHDPVREHLLALADEVAAGNGGRARDVEAVRTTRTGVEGPGTTYQPGVEVWLLQVGGDDYLCTSCSAPSGASLPRGRYLTLAVTVDGYRTTSFGVSPVPRELAALGEVQLLRGHRGPEGCTAPEGAPVVRLGGSVGTLRGNPDPVRVSLRTDERLTVRAQFAERHLSVPTATGAVLREVCRTEPPTSGGGTWTVVLEAVRPGSADVRTATDDCGPCAGLSFLAHVVVQARS